MYISIQSSQQLVNIFNPFSHRFTSWIWKKTSRQPSHTSNLDYRDQNELNSSCFSVVVSPSLVVFYNGVAQRIKRYNFEDDKKCNHTTHNYSLLTEFKLCFFTHRRWTCQSFTGIFDHFVAYYTNLTIFKIVWESHQKCSWICSSEPTYPMWLKVKIALCCFICIILKRMIIFWKI